VPSEPHNRSPSRRRSLGRPGRSPFTGFEAFAPPGHEPRPRNDRVLIVVSIVAIAAIVAVCAEILGR